MPLARLRLGQTHRADGRMAEHHRGDVVVVQVTSAHTAPQAVSQSPAGGNGHRCQRRTAGDIPDGQHAGHVGALVVINRHETRGIALHAHLRRDAAGQRITAYGTDDLIKRPDNAAVGQRHRNAGSGARQGRRRGAGDPRDARLVQRFVQAFNQQRIEAAQRMVTAQQQADLAAQCRQHTGDLDGDVTGADQRHAPGPLGHVKKPVAVQSQLGAGYGQLPRPAARGQQHLLGLQPLTVDLDHTGRNQLRIAADQMHLPLGQIALVDAVQARDVSIALGFKLCPVMATDLHRKAIFGGIVQRVRQLRGIPHDLLGYAAHVDAGAAQAAVLDKRDARAIVSRPLGRRQAATAPADDQQVPLGAGN